MNLKEARRFPVIRLGAEYLTMVTYFDVTYSRTKRLPTRKATI